MQAADREAFDTILAEIFAAIDKPLGETQREAFWKGLQRMHIVELARCRDQLLAELEKGEPPRKFGVGDVWGVKRRLRAPAPSANQPKEPEWTGDEWDEEATLHLQGYIRRRLGADPQAFGRPATYMGMKTMSTPHADASPEFVRVVQKLVIAKNLWAADMRDIAAHGDVAPEVKREAWNDYVKSVEADLAAAVAA